MDSYLEKFSPFLQKYWLPLTLALLGLIYIVYGLIGFIGGANKKPQAAVFSSNEKETQSKPQIAVDIEGAVISPGVYKLPEDSRIKDALAKAGGLSQKADRNWVAKNLNLAGKLTDSAKIYIPEAGESAVSQASSQTNTNTGIQTTGLININSASVSELDTLPGIGPATAEKIINGRPYASIQELVSKKIVTASVFEKIKVKITAF